MDHFNVRSGRYGDTPERLERFSRLEAAARDAAACLIEGGAEYLIGGTFSGAKQQAKTSRAPSP